MERPQLQFDFDHFAGLTITRAQGRQFALTETVDGSGVFAVPQFPFTQWDVLSLDVEDGQRIRIGTFQFDDIFPLCWWFTDDELPALEDAWTRTRDLPRLRGRVSELQVERPDIYDDYRLHDGKPPVESITLAVPGADITVMAGEVEEQWSGALDAVRAYGSLLLFYDVPIGDRIPLFTTWPQPAT